VSECVVQCAEILKVTVRIYLQTEELDIAAAAAALSELMSQVEGMRK